MFLSKLDATWMVGTKRSYRLNTPLIWQGAHKITVPDGFIFDGVSSPWYLWWAIPPLGSEADSPACLHDWLYGTHYYSRETSDRVFYRACLEQGLPKYKAWVAFKVLRLFGGKRWRANRASIFKLRQLELTHAGTAK